MSWNVIYDSGESMYLLDSETVFEFTRTTRGIDIAVIMTDLENANVPIKYTRDLRTIRFTKLPSGDLGNYAEGVIQLSVFKSSTVPISKVLVHELAHHLDDLEDIVSTPELIREKKNRAKFLNKLAEKNVDEYFAIGFEVYYFGDKFAKRKLRKMHPVLYKKIAAVHRKYRRI